MPGNATYGIISEWNISHMRNLRCRGRFIKIQLQISTHSLKWIFHVKALSPAASNSTEIRFGSG